MKKIRELSKYKKKHFKDKTRICDERVAGAGGGGDKTTWEAAEAPRSCGAWSLSCTILLLFILTLIMFKWRGFGSQSSSLYLTADLSFILWSSLPSTHSLFFSPPACLCPNACWEQLKPEGAEKSQLLRRLGLSPVLLIYQERRCVSAYALLPLGACCSGSDWVSADAPPAAFRENCEKYRELWL